MKNWRAIYSWHAWGSPVGMSLGYGIFVISSGVCLWLLSQAGLIGHDLYNATLAASLITILANASLFKLLKPAPAPLTPVEAETAAVA